MWDNRSSYVSNHDGDTVTYLSDMGRKIYNQAEVRLLGVWAPELKEVGGLAVKDFVRDWHEERRGRLKWPFLVTTTLVYAQDPDAAEVKKTLDRLIATVTCIATNECLNIAVSEYVAKQGFTGGIGS